MNFTLLHTNLIIQHNKVLVLHENYYANKFVKKTFDFSLFKTFVINMNDFDHQHYNFVFLEYFIYRAKFLL